MNEQSEKRSRGKYGTPEWGDSTISWTFPDGHTLTLTPQECGTSVMDEFLGLGIKTKLRNFLAVSKDSISLGQAKEIMLEGFAQLRAGQWSAERQAPGPIDVERLTLALFEVKTKAGVSVTMDECEEKVEGWTDQKRREVVRTYPEIAALYRGVAMASVVDL